MVQGTRLEYSSNPSDFDLARGSSSGTGTSYAEPLEGRPAEGGLAIKCEGESIGMRKNHSSLSFVILLLVTQSVRGDTFVVKEDDGNTASVEARLVGEGRGMVALERTDGRIEFVPQSQILKREVGPDPEPISCATMVGRLTEKFGADRFRAVIDAPYVVGLVLSEPLPKLYENKATSCLKKGATFMKTVEKVFLGFINELKIETEKPRFPLVLLIFETDDDFMQFATEETGGRGLSAGLMLGYYSGLTNRLVIRMSECHTFTTPLHEAIHQQVFNRGILQRLSPVPVWFNEGIATGFEGNGDKISGGPLKVSARYARAAMRAKTVDWDDVVADDKAFRGDVLASEAYAHAWSIHWFLVTKYRKQYVEYLQILGQKPPLQIDDAQTRTRDFERVFGKRIGKLQSEFPQSLESAVKKQKISLVEEKPVGYFTAQLNLAEVEISASKEAGGGAFETEGHLKNVSQIRPMSYVVTVETDTGTYAEWFLSSVAPSKVVPLSKQLAQKRMNGAPGGAAQTFRVKVKAAVPDGEIGKTWQRGQLPVPVWSE